MNDKKDTPHVTGSEIAQAWIKSLSQDAGPRLSGNDILALITAIDLASAHLKVDVENLRSQVEAWRNMDPEPASPPEPEDADTENHPF